MLNSTSSMGFLLQRVSALSLKSSTAAQASKNVLQIRGLRTGPYAQKPLRGADKALSFLKKNPKEYTPESVRTGAVGLKSGMTAIWDEWGVRVPVTVLHLKENQVVDRRTEDKHGYNAVQIGCYNKKITRTTRPLRGHFEKNGVDPKKKLMEFVVSKDGLLPLGTPISAAHFVPGQFVDVTATSLGKGFAGGMKRWGFKGLRATHGVSLAHRSIGSTGQRTDPGKVFKGKKMPGRLGGDRVTVQNLKVVKIDLGLNCVYVKGAVPGVDDTYVRIRDSLKKRNVGKLFPTGAKVPFPTYVPGVIDHPREVVAKSGKTVDPLVPLLD